MSAPPVFQNGESLPILWENRHFLVINKPSGLASHPGPRTSDSVESRLISQKRGGPWLVHRLDKDTAGCLLIAKRKTALIAAQQAFQSRKVQKTYWAIVQGRLPSQEGEITTSLKRIKHQNRWKIQPASDKDSESMKAHTLWRVLGETESLSWVELQLLTGRTHQARVHLASMKAPILGDPLYGPITSSSKAKTQHGLQLLSRRLELSLPFEETHITATASPAPEMETILRNYFNKNTLREQGP